MYLENHKQEIIASPVVGLLISVIEWSTTHEYNEIGAIR